MTAVVESYRRIAIFGGLKFIAIQTTAACDDSHTIDLNSDVAHGRAAAIQEILLTLVQDDAGSDETCTWDPATGIITMGNLTAAGIHNILIIVNILIINHK